MTNIDQKAEADRVAAMKAVGLDPRNFHSSMTAEKHAVMKAELIESHERMLDQYRPKRDG